MGIPSYFKRLTESVRGLLVPSIQGSVSCLLVDFNCIVYGCLRSDALPPVPADEDEQIGWERLLCDEVCKTLVTIWNGAGKPKTVFLAVDGVVPMAKIKQQRMRRFKSVWWAGKELEMGVRAPGSIRWDTNAITPGTAFMERLGLRLKEFCKARGWTVSTSDEPGEGEHKVMAWLREQPSLEGAVIIYGLDADLILLSMLTAKGACFLMREKDEFGSKQFATAKYLFLSVEVLRESLFPSINLVNNRQQLLDYIALMSLLGNDFLPHGMSLKIKEGGHDEILTLLRDFHERGLYFTENEQINWSTFDKLFAILSSKEEEWIFANIQKKKKARSLPSRNETEKAMLSVQRLPVDWFEEKRFLANTDWRSTYRQLAPDLAVTQYKVGMQWILDYYLGKKVNLHWFYPWHLPPLWADFEGQCHAVPASVTTEPPIQPQEQLALVLPMESWHLVRNPVLRAAPSSLPQFWPTKFGFMTIGKTWMWECEADIPILLPGRLRSVAAEPNRRLS